MTDWNSNAEALAALKEGKLPPGLRMEENTLIVPAGGYKGAAVIEHYHSEIRTEGGEVLKTRKPWRLTQ